MAGRVAHPDRVAAEAQRAFALVEEVDGRLRLDAKPEHLSLLHDVLVEELSSWCSQTGTPSASFARPTPVMWSRCAWVSRM